MKDYDCTIEYHPGKANVVTDALGQKMVEISARTIYYKKENFMALRAMNLNLNVEEDHLLAALQVKPSLGNKLEVIK